jgi:hypothetical protein
VRPLFLLCLLAGCVTPDVRRVEVVRPATLERDGVITCVYKRDRRLLRCMTPEDAYLFLTEERP